MSEATDHQTLVGRQFGVQANAYVASAVHAAGPDLDRLVAVAAEGRPGRALDLGCGGGHVSYALAPHAGTVVAYDLSAEMLAAVAATATERGLVSVETRQGDVRELPFDDATFDLVASRYSAHHWLDLPVALAEARRVARRGAAAVFMDAVSPAPGLLDTYLQGIELLRDPSHVRNWSVEEWTAMLERAGFETTAATGHRIRLDFASWIARMSTDPVHVAAIRSLQQGAPGEVRRHFAIEDDGSFLLDVATIEAVAK